MRSSLALSSFVTPPTPSELALFRIPHLLQHQTTPSGRASTVAISTLVPTTSHLIRRTHPTTLNIPLRRALRPTTPANSLVITASEAHQAERSVTYLSSALPTLKTATKVTMSPSENVDALLEELASHKELLASYNELLTLAPDDAETLTERASALAEIAALNKRIAAAKSTAQDDAPPQPKWDPTKHPKYNKPSEDAPPPPPADDTPTVFNVKELVLAKWSGDKQFYEATVITKTGSSADPVYTVCFKIDNSTETKRKHEVRAMPGKKRKADGAPSASTPAPPAISTPEHDFNSTVITAAPVVDKSAMQRKEPSMVSDGPTRMQPEKKKLKGGKVMENKKANWQTFMQNGPKKTAISASKHKESMFRTPDAPNAKVGVVGSGKPMQKDPSRSKWGNTAGKYVRDDDE